MQVSHDFTITEADIIVSALKEYSLLMKESGNYVRSGLADLLTVYF